MSDWFKNVPLTTKLVGHSSPAYDGIIYIIGGSDGTGIFKNTVMYGVFGYAPTITSSSISPTPFSPNGDGVKDETTIKATFSDEVTWSLQITDSGSAVKKSWTGAGTSLVQTWDGKDEDGNVVPDGKYSCIIRNVHGSAKVTKTIIVDTTNPTITDLIDTPDPFKPSSGQTTTISYTLSEKCAVTLKINNSAGKLIRTFSQTLLAGEHDTIWDGKDSHGKLVPSGLYKYTVFVKDIAGNIALKNGTITVTSSWYSLAPLPTPRRDFAAVAYNGKIYTFGGYGASGRLSVVEVYDPSSNSWSTATPMPSAMDNVGAGLIGGRIYVLGWDGSQTRFYRYNPATNSWVSRAAPPVSQFGQAGYGVVNGLLYVAYGSSTQSWTYAYNPSTNTWTEKRPVSDIAVRSIESFAVLNNKLYAIGGWEPKAGATEILRIDVYDPATDSWQKGSIPDMPGGRTHLSPTTPVVNGKIYVIGGWDGGSTKSTVFVYDPMINTWIHETNMPTARYELACAWIGDRIFALGGDSGGSGGNYKSKNEVLDLIP